MDNLSFLFRFPGEADAAFTIATMPAQTASGSLSQRSAINAKSGELRAKSAKQNA